MKEKSKEEQLRIVLQNYDRKAEELETANAQIEALQQELKQQKILYKNMLDRYTGHDNIRPNTDWEAKFNMINGRYQKKCQEYSAMRPYFLYMRDTIAHLYAKSEKICSRAESFETETSSEPQDESEKQPSQNEKFITYIRQLQEVYKKTKGLCGISQMANKLGIKALTKVQFFEFGLNDNVTDDEILRVYEIIKKR